MIALKIIIIILTCIALAIFIVVGYLVLKIDTKDSDFEQDDSLIKK